MAKKKTIKDVEAEEKVSKKAKKVEVEEIEKETEEVIDDEVTTEETVEKEDKKVKKEEKKKEKEEKKKEKNANKKEGYFASVWKELKKVVWPSIGEITKYSLAVILFCLILVLFFLGIDALASLIKGLF